MRWKKLLAVFGLLPGCAAGITLQPGDPAPDFALAGSDGQTHRLAAHKGKRVVVLAWFPKAFTGG